MFNKCLKSDVTHSCKTLFSLLLRCSIFWLQNVLLCFLLLPLGKLCSFWTSSSVFWIYPRCPALYSYSSLFLECFLITSPTWMPPYVSRHKRAPLQHNSLLLLKSVACFLVLSFIRVHICLGVVIYTHVMPLEPSCLKPLWRSPFSPMPVCVELRHSSDAAHTLRRNVNVPQDSVEDVEDVLFFPFLKTFCLGII